MKTIIEGHLYNTETAFQIAWFYFGGTSLSDFNFVEQKLYQTRKWRFFLYICGWARTEFASRYGNSSTYGERIQKMEVEDIAKWIEENNERFSSKNIDTILNIIPFEEA